MPRAYRAVWIVAFLLAVIAAYRLGEAAQNAAEDHQNQGLVLSGDVALWTVAIKTDKTADFEKVLGAWDLGFGI